MSTAPATRMHGPGDLEWLMAVIQSASTEPQLEALGRRISLSAGIAKRNSAVAATLDLLRRAIRIHKPTSD